ncbi:LCP family protein [Spirillospora sp. CA-294931]|uniref:LCP family protein n=1 Tax=Spirillospora sp. CA-294931 TaxID=3240042 RepID=UPI003D8D9A3D
MYDGGPISARLEAHTAAPEALPPDLPPPPPRRAPSLAEALLLTALSAPLPGLAHLRAGWVRTGTALLLAYGLALTAVVVIVCRTRSGLIELAVRPGWLATLVGVCVLAGVLWALLTLHSYLVLRPEALTPAGRVCGGIAATALCLLAAAPALTAARYGQLQRELVEGVFAEEPAAAGAPAALPQADPFARTRRLDVLLIGGDADVGRVGIRTDSMTLASVDTRTGNTVLFGLPRNLQKVPVPATRARFPAKELLNAVYHHGSVHPPAFGRPVRDPGAELLKRTVSRIVGRPVPYYAMVDMRSFRQIVDAMGGVRVCVERAVPVPRQQVPGGVLRPGCRRLSGREALWYGRSRTGSSDYSRMSRQKCLMWGLVRQASPMTVLRSFQRLSRVFRASVSTDIPRGLLPHLAGLSVRAKGADITSLQFVPPLVNASAPDYAAIRGLTARAIAESGSDSPGVSRVHMLNKTCT